MKICFFVVRGWVNNLAVEQILAEALERRGHEVEFVDCDGLLPFCHLSNTHQPEFARNCELCRRSKAGYRQRFRTSHLALDPAVVGEIRDELSALDLAGCLAYTRAGFPVGRYAESSTKWFLCRSTLVDADLDQLREAVASTAIVLEAMGRDFERSRPDAVVTLNGEFFAERAVLELCRARGIRVVTHELTFYFKVVAAVDVPVVAEMTARESLANEWKPRRADLERARRFRDEWIERLGYLSGLGIDHESQSAASVRDALALDSRPVCAAFGNVTFDTGMQGRDRAFATIFEWALFLIQYFEARPDYQLVLRCHPAESRYAAYRTREPLSDFIHARRAKLPENVRVVDATSDLSSYALLELSTPCLVYTSTIGLETAMRGRLPLTAANAHYGRRGFTEDPDTREEYVQALERHLATRQMLSSAQSDALLRYVDYFFQHRLLGLRGLTVRAVRGELPEVRATHPVGRLLRPDRGLDALVAAVERGEMPILRERPLDAAREALGSLLQRARAGVRKLGV